MPDLLIMVMPKVPEDFDFRPEVKVKKAGVEAESMEHTHVWVDARVFQLLPELARLTAAGHLVELGWLDAGGHPLAPCPFCP